jgi:AcrR family transcriptional regulator
MAIPALTGDRPWSDLCAEEKRARALAVADELFARGGVELPMPALAEAIGVGVGSIYRLFDGKEDVLAALVIARIEAVRERFEAAAEADDPWQGLRRATLDSVDAAASDHLAQRAWELSARPDVQPFRTAAGKAIEAVVERARAAGALRDDVTTQDVGLVLATAKRAEGLEPGGARRLAELVLRGMAAGAPPPPPPPASATSA